MLDSALSPVYHRMNDLSAHIGLGMKFDSPLEVIGFFVGVIFVVNMVMHLLFD